MVFLHKVFNANIKQEMKDLSSSYENKCIEDPSCSDNDCYVQNIRHEVRKPLSFADQGELQ